MDSDMELDDSVGEGGRLEEVRDGEGETGRPSEEPVSQAAKRRKVASQEEEGTSECATVGLLTFPENARLIGRDLDAALLGEKDKKKISAAFYKQMLVIRDRYEVLLDEALRQNTVLQGRVEEARRASLMVGSVRNEVKDVVVVEKKKAKVQDKQVKTTKEVGEAFTELLVRRGRGTRESRIRLWRLSRPRRPLWWLRPLPKRLRSSRGRRRGLRPAPSSSRRVQPEPRRPRGNSGPTW